MIDVYICRVIFPNTIQELPPFEASMESITL